MTITSLATYFIGEQTRTRFARMQGELTETQSQIATGKKVTDLSEGGVGSSSIVMARDMLSRFETRAQALREVSPRLELQDAALGAAADVAKNLRLDVLKMISLGDASSLPETLKQAFATASSQMNAQYNGFYMFGGDRVDTAPVTVASLDALAAAASGPAAFATVARQQTIDLGEGFATTVADRAVDLGGVLFDGIRDIKILLDANGGALGKPPTPVQQAALEAAMVKLDSAAKTLTAAQARNGDLQNRVDREITTSDDRASLLTKTIGESVDADLAGLSIRLNQLMTQYQASATTFSQIKDMSLLNFLK